MENGMSDFRSFMIELGNALTDDNVRKVAYYFELGDRIKDGIDLIDKLECDNQINAANVNALIEPLTKINQNVLVERVVEYQRRVDDDPMIRDSSVFAGRSEELDDIRGHMDVDETASGLFRAVFIAGMPGVGKTSLAEEFVRCYSAEFHRVVHFISCRGYTSLSPLIDSLKEELKLQISSSSHLNKALETKLRYNNRNLLIILDNVEDLMKNCKDKFDDFLANLVSAGRRAKSKRHCVVVTSRLQLDEEVAVKLLPEMLRLRLDEMGMEDSKTLLRKYLGDRRVSGEELERLANMCGRHPLSMALVANRLRLAPNIEVEMLEGSMERQPLATLRGMEELRNLPTRSCIEGTFENIFNGLKHSEQELLIALAAAPHDMSWQTAVHVSGREKDHVEMDLALMRLLEFNLISCRVEDRRKNRSRRYSMHLLTRNFVQQFCRLSECPKELRSTWERAKKRLVGEYIKGMKTLSMKEFVNPESFAKDVRKERLNYLSLMGEIFDALISRESNFDDLIELNSVVFKVMYGTQEHVNLLKQCLEAAKRADCPHFLKLVELKLANMIRLNGNLEDAKRRFAVLHEELFEKDIGLTEMHQRRLQTYHLRYFGCCLKDDTSGNVMRTLSKSADNLRKAIDRFQDTTVFTDLERQKRELAETYYDLGNTLVLLADQYDTDKVSNLRQARENFEKTKHIFMEYNRKTSRLFDVHLSLASCDMEIMSWHQSPDGSEDRTTLGAALEHFTNAEKIANENGPLVKEDPVRMGNLCYARAICLYRAKDYEAAAPDAQKALKMRKQVFRTHNKTMNCYMLLGLIYSSCLGIHRRKPRTLNCYEQALHMAYRLKRRKKEVSRRDLDSLEFRLNTMCERMEKDFSEYERIFTAIRQDSNIVIDSSKFPDMSNSESDESNMSDHPTATELKKAFDGHSSDDPEDEGSNAPSCAKARDLSKKLKTLMNRNAELIQRNYDELDVADMDILACILESGYPNMNDEQKKVRYEKGIKMFNELSRLDKEPALFLTELHKRKKGGSNGPETLGAAPLLASSLIGEITQRPPVWNFRVLIGVAVLVVLAIILKLLLW